MATQTPVRETRETFKARCEVFFPHQDVIRIMIAYILAKGCHAHQFRQDEKDASGNPVRYFEHVRRVALIIMDEAHMVISPDVIIMALLHDAYEDTHLTLEEITLVFGSEISRRVALMSKKPKANFRERLMTHGDWMVWAAKAADRIDNLRHMGNSSAAFIEKQKVETKEMYLPLLDLLIEKAPEEVQEGARTLRRLLLETLFSLP